MKMKQILGGFLALLMLTGCANHKVQTPDSTTSVNQNMLLEKAVLEQDGFHLPERYTGDWTAQEGKVTIHADAEITADLGTVLPTATVTPREFNQADVDNLLRVFLKGQPLYGFVQTKQELKNWIDWINSDAYEPDPDAPGTKEERRKQHNAKYAEWVKTAPDEKPVVHGFADSDDPNFVRGSATVDGVEYDISICNGFEGAFRRAIIEQKDYKYRQYDASTPAVAKISKEEATAKGNALMQELGFDKMVLDDVQLWEDGTWQLYYTPTVNGIPIPAIRAERYDAAGNREFYCYKDYSASEETNPDKVSWYQESIRLSIGKDGVLSFQWDSPSGETVIKSENTALMPFDKIASIADSLLPVVIIGPSEARSITDIDRIDGFDTHFDVNITKVSLSLMRVRDKGSLQGTIVPVWDFWGTTDWSPDNAESWEDTGNYDYDCLMTLNAIDGSVVSRLFGY